jgi:hypothetical protein
VSKILIVADRGVSPEALGEVMKARTITDRRSLFVLLLLGGGSSPSQTGSVRQQFTHCECFVRLSLLNSRLPVLDVLATAEGAEAIEGELRRSGRTYDGVIVVQRPTAILGKPDGFARYAAERFRAPAECASI